MRYLHPAAAPLAVAGALLFAGAAQAHGFRAVYTETNSADGNAVQVLTRGDDGRLTPAGSVSTGGRGTSAGLGSQGAVALSGDGRVLLAVDAASNDVAAFRVGRQGLTLAGRVPSRGTMPVSVAIHGHDAYVLNAGGFSNVAAFRVSGDGTLTPRFGGRAPLAEGANGPAEVAVSPDGSALVVTERVSSRLETFPLRHGIPGDPVTTPSSGPTPFGFAFDRSGDAIVSEAINSTASSYRLRSGALQLVSASVPTLQGAACWVATTPDGRFAYTGNAATGSITGFAIAADGSLTRVTEDGRTASTPRPNDLAVAGGYLYAINPLVGSVTAYHIHDDGSLEALPAATGLPQGLAGLAAA
jgi:6-phosphogluconolactonase (cycloisomerase 2 family)